MHRILLASLLLLPLASGCAQWVQQTPTEANKLPTPPLPPDSVVLEIAFARLPLADMAAYDEIWQQTDEQAFSTDLRRAWSANGLRCGMLGSQLPPKLRQALEADAHSLLTQAENALEAQADGSRGSRRVQCRSGRRAKLITSKSLPEMALLAHEAGTVRGWSLTQAQCLFGMKVYPLGDARARLNLVPEVEHGAMKTQYVGREGTVMPELARERIVLDELLLDATLPPGHVLLISTTPDVKGLGKHFFVEQSANAEVRQLVLIRLAVSQHDDLFAPDQMGTPVATP